LCGSSLLQALTEQFAGRVACLEAGVGGGVPALVEHLVDSGPVEAGMQLGAIGTGHAVDGPGVLVIRLRGEVGTGVDVVVAGGGDQRVVIAVPAEVLGEPLGDRGTSGDGQAATLAEVVLHVHHDERLLHSNSPPSASRTERSRSFSIRSRASSISSSTRSAGQTTTPSSSAITRSPGQMGTPPILTSRPADPPPCLVAATGVTPAHQTCSFRVL